MWQGRPGVRLLWRCYAIRLIWLINGNKWMMMMYELQSEIRTKSTWSRLGQYRTMNNLLCCDGTTAKLDSCWVLWLLCNKATVVVWDSNQFCYCTPTICPMVVSTIIPVEEGNMCFNLFQLIFWFNLYFNLYSQPTCTVYEI